MTKIDIPFPELRKAIVALNESGLITGLDVDKLAAIGVSGKIKLVAISREDMFKHFMGTFDLIEDGPDGKCPAPKEALDFYNKVIELEEKAKAVVPEEGSATETTVTAEKEKKEKPAKEKKVSGKNKSKQEGSARTIISNVVNSSSLSKEQIFAKCKEQNIQEKHVKMYLRAWEKGDRVPFGKSKLSEKDGILVFV